MPIQSYRQLKAWQVGMDFVTQVYVVTRQFPREERFGLTAQLRRAAVSIPSNISEGHQHRTKAYARYVTIALGSLAEGETQIEVARRLEFADPKALAGVADTAATLRRILYGLRRSLRAKLQAAAKRRTAGS